MNSIRKLLALGTGTVGLVAVVAFALAPVTTLAEGSQHWSLWRAAALNAKSFAPPAATLSPACLDAIQAAKTAIAADRAEDQDERANAAGTDPAADVQEDTTERAAIKALWVSASNACAPELATKSAHAAPTAACAAAQQAVKDAAVRKDYAALRSLWTSMKTACGFSSASAFTFRER